MDRRTFLAALAALLTLPRAARAQPTRPWRIGWLSPASASTDGYELEALRDGLRKLNYVDGRSITIEARWGEGDASRLPSLARSLVTASVDVICTSGTPATQAAKAATKSIPIIFGRAAFPDQTGLVSNLTRPGGNLTGVTFIGPEYGKRLELLKEVSPRISRVALLYNDRNAASVLAMHETQEWAKTLQVAVEPLGVHDSTSLQAAFAAMLHGKAEAVMTTADPLLASIALGWWNSRMNGVWSRCTAIESTFGPAASCSMGPVPRTCGGTRPGMSTVFSRGRRQVTSQWSSRRSSS